MNVPNFPAQPQHDERKEGWQGHLSLDFDHKTAQPDGGSNIKKGGVTRLFESHGIAPLKVQRPFYPEGDRVCHSVIVHTAGGMVGGDRLNLAINLQPSAHALVTTAAASKAYKSNGQSVQQSIHMTVSKGACLEWLPQSLILFNGAQYHQHLRVDLEPGAMWLGWDITRLGRTLRGETFEDGEWRSHIEIWQDGYPLWIDPQWIQGGSKMLTSAHGLAHCPVVGTFAMMGVEVSEDIINQARELWTENINRGSLNKNTSQQNEKRQYGTRAIATMHNAESMASIGVSQLQSGLICRYRGTSTIAAQQWFMAIWRCLRQSYLKRPICPPRVWQLNTNSRYLSD